MLSLIHDATEKQDVKAGVVDVSVLSRLRTAGLRPTIARICVLQVIEAAGEVSVGAEDVLRRMAERGVQASAGTVFRVIRQMHAAGLLLNEWGPNRKALYRIKPEGFDAALLQVVCPASGRMVAMNDPKLYAALVDSARCQGVELAGQSLSVGVATRPGPTAPLAQDR